MFSIDTSISGILANNLKRSIEEGNLLVNNRINSYHIGQCVVCIKKYVGLDFLYYHCQRYYVHGLLVIIMETCKTRVEKHCRW
jgi:hypothetical protein